MPPASPSRVRLAVHLSLLEFGSCHSCEVPAGPGHALGAAGRVIEPGGGMAGWPFLPNVGRHDGQSGPEAPHRAGQGSTEPAFRPDLSFGAILLPPLLFIGIDPNKHLQPPIQLPKNPTCTMK